MHNGLANGFEAADQKTAGTAADVKMQITVRERWHVAPLIGLVSLRGKLIGCNVVGCGISIHKHRLGAKVQDGPGRQEEREPGTRLAAEPQVVADRQVGYKAFYRRSKEYESKSYHLILSRM